MSEIDPVIERIFDDVKANEDEVWNARLWQVLERGAYTRLGVPVEAGGSGGGLTELGSVLLHAGRTAAQIPALEAILLAPWLLAQAGLPGQPGIITLIDLRESDIELLPRSGGAVVDGTAEEVPWARIAGACLVVSPGERGLLVALVNGSPAVLREAENLYGEPLDAVRFDRAEALLGHVDETAAGLWSQRRVLGRCMLLTGVLDGMLAISVDFARQRHQFGRPIVKFQAVQHLLARLAEEASVARASLDRAVHALELCVDPAESAFAVHAAKVRIGEAAGLGAKFAHQVHGALGYTDEYVLSRYSKRAVIWRDKDGTEASHALEMGRLITSAGAGALWDLLKPAH